MRKRYITKTFLKKVKKELKDIVKSDIEECKVDSYLYDLTKCENETEAQKFRRTTHDMAEHYTMMYLNNFIRDMGQYFEELEEDLKL